MIASCAVLLASCEKPTVESVEKPVESGTAEELKRADMPILPVEKGDFWKYDVHVEVPAGVTSEGSSAMDLNQEKTRTYLGKVKPSPELPETDAFDVVSPGESTQREFVEITPESVMMRGSARPDILDSKPIWLDPAVPFAIAGMRPGQEMVPLKVQGGARTRGMKVVAREKVKVPAGEFSALRLLMTGKDGNFEIRRTTWFSPGIGIVKEEKTRYAGEKLLFRETTELTETNVKR